jgi:predicted 3-demethylubiquinone-9 3-methyltransferase (glyoxalase superfamily)
MPKITNCLWFDKEAEEAANYYTSFFPNSKIKEKTYYDEASSKVAGMPKDSLLTISFDLDGQEFLGLNGGHFFKFSEATSFIVNCEDQDEVDHYWEKLSAVPESEQCGWCKDKFGVSWQVVPKQLEQLLSDPDKEKAGRAMEAMLEMKKLDIAKLEAAAEGK